MTPSDKTPDMETSLTNLFGFDRRENITNNKCCPPPIGCGGNANDFDDECSRREFAISGLCQRCQNKIFGDDGEGAKLWTLENALPIIRALEAVCNKWGYFTALAGSVLYAGQSDNDLDIHLYEEEGNDIEHDSQAVFDWFAAQGWEFSVCGDPLSYGSSVTIFEAEQDGLTINLFFTQLIEVPEPKRKMTTKPQ